MNQLGLAILEVGSKAEGMVLLNRHGANVGRLLVGLSWRPSKASHPTISATTLMLWMLQYPATPFSKWILNIGQQIATSCSCFGLVDTDSTGQRVA